MEKNSETLKSTGNYSRDLFNAAFDGDLKKVKLILEEDKQFHHIDINKGNEEGGTTSLFVAAENGHLEVVKLLIEYKSVVNTPTKDGRTPLMGAAGKGCLEVVQLLLQNGADINCKWYGRTAVEVAHDAGEKKILNLLKEVKVRQLKGKSN